MVNKSLLSEDAASHSVPGRDARIAYFILVHRLPNQFKRLFTAIYHPDNYYLIHIDKKATDEVSDEINLFLQNYSNASVMTPITVTWGGYSMVQAELNGMRHLLSLNVKWDYFINLSGQDYPLKPQEYIQGILGSSNMRNYIKVLNQELERPDTLNRIKYIFSEDDVNCEGKGTRRRYMSNTTAYIGGQWMILTRLCCEFICYSEEAKKFEEYYKNTLIPDESFFQTLLMNTSFKGTIVSDDKRAIIWIPDGRIKLRPKTYTKADLFFLLSSSALFARKFDDSVDPDIVDQIAFKSSGHINRDVVIEDIESDPVSAFLGEQDEVLRMKDLLPVQ